MNETVKSRAGWEPLRIITAALLGVASGLVLFIAATQGNKWLLAASMGLISSFSLFVLTRNFRFFFILLATFFLSLRLDFHLIFKVTDYAQLRGLPVTMFDIAFVLLFAYWILQLLRRQETLHLFPSISIPALGYMLLAGISAFLSKDRVLSIAMFLLIVKAYLVFLYFANNIKTKEEILGIARVLTLSVFIQSIIGILQFVSGGTLGLEIFGESERAFRATVSGYAYLSRVGGTIGSPNSLAMYLNFILPIILCVLLIEVHFRFRLFAWFALFLGCVTELLTRSRGGWIAFCLGLSVVLYGIFKERLKSRFKSIILIFIIFVFIFVVILALFSDVRIRLFEDDYSSAYGRISMMKVAFNVIKENPLIGVGLNNYTTVMNKYDRTRDNVSYRFPFPVHNAFLIIASESGLLALFCFLFIFFTCSRKAMLFFKGKDRFLSLLGIGWFSGILTWIIHAQFKMDFAGINIALWFSLGMVVAIHRMLGTAKTESTTQLN